MPNTYSLPFIDDYLLNLQTDNRSEKTVYNYERDLQVFEDFLTDAKIPFKKLKKRDINNYKAYLASIDRKTPKRGLKMRKLASYSRNRMLSALRSYLKFLDDMDYKIPIAPESIKLIKTERKHPKVAEMNELIKLIESPTDLEKNKIVGLRNRAMLEVLFSTGMRISELLSLNRDQIDDTGKIFIMGKGKKERFVYMTPRAYQQLKNYLNQRKDTLPALFIPYRGKNASQTTKRISPNYLQAKIKKYRQLLRINIPISAHSLRHGFATYLAEHGASPAAIQILLGHESLATTTRYINASDRFAEETHRRFHPLKK